MSWYLGASEHETCNGYVLQSSDQRHNRVSAELPTLAPPAYGNARLNSYQDDRTQSRSANVSFSDQLLPYTNYENIAPVTMPASSGGLGKKSQKRKLAEAYHASNDKRLRPDGLPTATRVVSSGELPRRSHSGLHRGTQHDPLEIESSPEPEAKIPALPGHAAYLAQSAYSETRQPNLKEAGLRIHGARHSAGKPKFYAVPGGHNPGIYTSWEDVEQQIRGFSGAKHKKFASELEAWAYMQEHVDHVQGALKRRGYRSQAHYSKHTQPVPSSPPPPYMALLDQNPSMRREGSPSTDNWHDLSHYSYDSYHADSMSTRRADNTDSIVPEPEPILSPEQQQVVDVILEGKNVFYTGSAGCGKSTILKAFVRQLKARGQRVKIIAPTNLAALNVNGQTTWNYAGWTPDSMKKPLDKLMSAASGKEVWERFDTTDVLVLDEVSMVENLMFERLNHIMRHSRGQKHGGGPFGGAQMIVTGDFCQLAPVKPFRSCIGCGWDLIPDNKYSPKEHRCENKRCKEDVFYDIDKWAFRSKAWEECNFTHINLTEIHRQHDKKFISILQRIRTEGVILPNHARILLNHPSETNDAIKIFSRRDDVDRVNNENIAQLPAQPHMYKCLDNFDWKEHHQDDRSLEKNTRLADDGSGSLHALKEHRYDIFVQLKEGQRIVLQANMDPMAGLVNGSQGAIIDFEPYDPKRLPRKADAKPGPNPLLPPPPPPGTKELRGTHAHYQQEQIKLFAQANGRPPWPVVRFDNGLTRTVYADCTANELGNDEPHSLLSRTQIPLMAGYAITVHKSQGMTLDRVIVDLARAFEPSQIYVALSRARSLQGLKVVGLPQRNLGGANAQVKEFFDKYLTKK